MKKRKLVTRLVEINQTLERLKDLGMELSGPTIPDSGIIADFYKLTDLLMDIVLEDIPANSAEYNIKIDKCWDVYFADMTVKEKVDAYMRLGKRY